MRSSDIGRRRTPRVFLIALTLLLGWLTAAMAAHTFYTVKRGDTLYGVARRYGTTVAALAEKNGLKPTAWLQIGQKLLVPVHSKASGQPALPAAVQRAITSARVRAGRWKLIVIHHSGTSQATIRGMNLYHLKERHMENGLAYHFVIGNGHGVADGKIYVGHRWKAQLDGGHLASPAQNHIALGICLVGNFERQKPTRRQLDSLTALVRALQKRCHLGLDAVVMHREINVRPTRCPGKNFPMKSFKSRLARASS